MFKLIKYQIYVRPWSLGLMQMVVLIAINIQLQAQQQPPNILLITIDDLNQWVGHLGTHPMVKTPNIDLLASRGVSFSNAHAQAPLCNPSRTSFLTGLRPTTTGVYALGPWFRSISIYRDWVTLPQYFEAHGYHTMSAGKVFHDAYPPEEDRRDGPEFTTWGFKGGFFPRPDEPLVSATGHPLVDWGVFPQYDSLQDDWKVAEWAIENLTDRPDDQPFFLSVGFRHPHVPLYAAQHWFDLYSSNSGLLPKVQQNDRADIPEFAWYLHWRLPEPRLAWLKEHRQWESKVRAYLASISFVDMLVGRLIKTLENEGLTDNTLVVLFSDHGYHLGTKDITGKNSLWRESTAVPLIFAGPGIAPADSTCKEAVELLDIYPTLVELAGLPPNHNLEGESLLSLLVNPELSRSKPALCTHGPGNHAIITEEWRYIRYADGSDELYDLVDDPHEWHNLAQNSKYEKVIQHLSAYIPASQPPASGNNIRLIDYRDGDVYWEGDLIKPQDPVPMQYK